ncbi:penicillin-binding transpeptidase domain-containing protein [Metabacillus fastidiosus]|uniref:penicillin-binding transpeptidase domain-containing protein n=2 Tax=Metabacillus fastidiosus TaxID=1458 RepID=UPI003D2CF519
MKKLYFIFTLLCFVIILSSCSNKPTAEQRLNEYINLWNKQDFSEMYRMLSADTQEKVSEKNFIDRYKNIYEAISVKNLKISTKEIEEKENEKENVSLPLSLSMETVAGPISFTKEVTLQKEEKEGEKNWYINWDPSFIFPQLKEGDEVKITSDEPLRGEIYDRNNNGLAVNGTAYEIGIIPQNLPENKDETLNKLAVLLEIDRTQIDAKLNESWVKPDLFVPIKKIDPADRERFEQIIDLPAVQKKDSPSRYYPAGEASAHLIGYIGSITAEQLEKLKDKGYSANSVVGKSGLEQVFEDRLKGETGYKIFVGGTNEVIAEKQARNGEAVYLTIDYQLQKNMYEQLKGDAGTAVALNPVTGETLAMVSSPAYNPNEFIFGMGTSKYRELSEDPLKPLMARFNKLYSPGSSLKPLVGAIGLETGTVKGSDVKKIEGPTWQKDASWGNYFVKRVSTKASDVNLQKALMYSDNIYFAQLALGLGSEKFSTGLKQFGFDEKIDFIFPTGQSSIANSALSNEQLLADSGYGQGEIQMSPLHLAAAYTTFLNEGNMLKPYLEKTDEANVTVWKEKIISSETAAIILDDLKQVVENPEGTAYAPKLEGVQLAGKTGTAELKQSKDDTEGKENGWFVAADMNERHLLTAMMIEDVKSRGGSHYVVPKVKKVFEQYVKNNPQE